MPGRRQVKRSSPALVSKKDEPKSKRTATDLYEKPYSDSSSESDIENYLKPAAEIDLNSSFFQTKTPVNVSLHKTSKDTSAAIDISEPESDNECLNSKETSIIQEQPVIINECVPKEQVLSFEHIQTYNNKLEEAKRHIEIYKANRDARENNINISDILAMGEAKSPSDNISSLVDSNELETYSESEREEWEEINSIDKDSLIPKRGVQITVDVPGNIRKKKGTDLMDMVKRRINRIKKENQVYVHKVHLLCWIAHGNCVNKVLCNENLMGLSLSLLPSQKSYPPQRLDISYLQDILQWYQKAIKITQQHFNSEKCLQNALEEQIMNREAYDYKCSVYIFICLLRSLGIRCRMMLSLQVEPLRPTPTDLCSLSKINLTSSEGKRTANKVVHSVKSTPSRNSLKINTSKVVSTKKISHVTTKSSKLKNVKIKKLDFEDLCYSMDASIKSTSNKTNENSKPNKSKIGKVSYNGTINLKDCDNKEHVNLHENEIPKKKQSKGDKINKSANVANNSKTSDKHSKETKQQSKKMNISCQNKSISNNTKKTKGEYNRQKNKGCETNEDIKDIHKSSCKKQKDMSLLTDKGTDYKDKEELSRNSKRDKNRGKTNTLEIPLRRSQRLSKSPENMNQVSVSAKDISKLKDDVNVTKSSEITQLNRKAKVNLIGLGIKKPLKLNVASTKNNDIKTTDKAEKNLSVAVLSEKLLKNSIPQLDGGNDDTDSASEATGTTSKPSLKKLKNNSSSKCLVKQHPKRLKKTVQYKEINSDEDFRNSDVSPNKDISLKKDLEKNSNKSTRNIKVKVSKSHESMVNPSLLRGATSRHFKHVTGGEMDVKNDIINLVKKNISEEKSLLRLKLVKQKRSQKPYTDSDSDYIPVSTKDKPLENDFKEKSVKVKRRIPMKRDLIEMEKNKQAQKEEEKKNKGVNVWVEVFVEAEEKWISIDVLKGQIHCVKEIYTRATHPVSYILSWDNEHHVKDLTKRYCSNWNTVTRKLRVDDKWWNETLLPYKALSNAREREEDEELARQQLEQPLPTTISEYKNHPLYVLKRHLLKFEAIYPPDSLILGFVRNEPVYSRECVHVLHSREIWLKHAKVVKLGESPYKIVKSRPKYDKLSNSIITDQPLEIFGKWQVEDYVPPTAENGVVPRNAYGNVELFKPSMLPKGTVHLQLPGLNKIARKMNIDCAPAIIGFDFHGGWSHPTYDGFIVCEEFSEQLIAGWYQEQEESEKRAQEKLEKRVYENWRRLIRGLLIRERLKAKYDFGEGSFSSRDGKPKKKGLILKKRKVCSDSDTE
ncbi:hypothetical protein Trydic_g4215 [Trypoxylus dichotomus]